MAGDGKIRGTMRAAKRRNIGKKVRKSGTGMANAILSRDNFRMKGSLIRG